ncbi:hypothetical protein ACIBK9_45390 [Nonomuraea sp. NPDC050227]|uniref:hypothetical protein n=1 Tax=Nonomuraea sp. NPDC050227 TaxID=3364360 RepID=UPI00378D6DAF
MHALRHFYASVLPDAGENIKALSEYLGHHDPGFTLRTYTQQDLERLLPAGRVYAVPRGHRMIFILHTPMISNGRARIPSVSRTGHAAFARRLAPGGHMQRGEVWWVDFDERRPVVLLSDEESSGFQAMQVVAPAGVEMSGLGVEVAVGAPEGLPFEGVLRFAFPRPGFTPCTWLTTVARDDLIERAGALSSVKLSEVGEAVRAAGERREWTPMTAARFSEIKDARRLEGSE